MAAGSLEQKVMNLEKEIERLQAVNEIQNLMSTYEYLHTANMHKEVMAMYAKKVPDVRVYFGELGYWEGPDAPQKAWGILDRMSKDGRIGMMAIHPITTQAIEVAGDGKTAKGVWIGVGFVARPDSETGKPQCRWEWDKYGVDFIKEDGQWKFWHFHIYRIFHGLGWDDKWADQFGKPETGMGVPDDLKPGHPAVDDNPYRPDTVQLLAPAPPKPYKTWKDTKPY